MTQATRRFGAERGKGARKKGGIPDLRSINETDRRSGSKKRESSKDRDSNFRHQAWSGEGTRKQKRRALKGLAVNG